MWRFTYRFPTGARRTTSRTAAGSRENTPPVSAVGVALDALPRLALDNRRNVRRERLRLPDGEDGYRAREALEQGLDHRLVRENPRARRAFLPRVVEGRPDDPRNGLVEVGVGVH